MLARTGDVLSVWNCVDNHGFVCRCKNRRTGYHLMEVTAKNKDSYSMLGLWIDTDREFPKVFCP